MLKRSCSAANCSSLASGYSNYCSSHRKTKTRHGDPMQGSITVARLRPYLKMVEDRQTSNRESEAWTILQQRWSRMVEDATLRVGRSRAGEVSIRHQVEAANQVLDLAGSNEPMKIIATSMAMFLMLEFEPRAFVSDAGFDFQLVRRVRSLAPMSSGSYWSQRDRRTTKVYRDIAPRTVEALAWDLRNAFGAAGLQLAGLVRSQVVREDEERLRLERAIASFG